LLYNLTHHIQKALYRWETNSQIGQKGIVLAEGVSLVVVSIAVR